MTKVFISGSISIKNIHPLVIERIDNMIKSNFEIIIGDANGVDVSIQEILKNKSYYNVKIYCSGNTPRNNLFSWPLIKVQADNENNKRDFYTAKDVVMSQKCDYGLMIWDLKSTGTLSNIIRLLKQNKKSLVFINKTKSFQKVSNVFELDSLLINMSESALEKANLKISLQQQLFELKQGNLFSNIKIQAI